MERNATPIAARCLNPRNPQKIPPCVVGAPFIYAATTNTDKEKYHDSNYRILCEGIPRCSACLDAVDRSPYT
jgi:hypothetical protein